MATVKFYDRNNHCVAVISVALPGMGQATVAGVGGDKADALARAASIAKRIADDPVMSALMPPQAKAAIVAARGLAAAAQRGLPTLKHFWSRIHGPGKRRLAAALIKEQQTADVGWNPLKRKRKRRPARRIAPPARAPMEQEQEPEDEMPDDGVNTEQGED